MCRVEEYSKQQEKHLQKPWGSMYISRTERKPVWLWQTLTWWLSLWAVEQTRLALTSCLWQGTSLRGPWLPIPRRELSVRAHYKSLSCQHSPKPTNPCVTILPAVLEILFSSLGLDVSFLGLEGLTLCNKCKGFTSQWVSVLKKFISDWLFMRGSLLGECQESVEHLLIDSTEPECKKGKFAFCNK